MSENSLLDEWALQSENLETSWVLKNFLILVRSKDLRVVRGLMCLLSELTFPFFCLKDLTISCCPRISDEGVFASRSLLTWLELNAFKSMKLYFL